MFPAKNVRKHPPKISINEHPLKTVGDMMKPKSNIIYLLKYTSFYNDNIGLY